MERSSKEEIRRQAIMLVQRLLIGWGDDPLQASARRAYDAVGWFSQQNPSALIADWYFTARGKEVDRFYQEWTFWQKMQQARCPICFGKVENPDCVLCSVCSALFEGEG